MLTGCRRNEIVELEWKNVDLASGELRLPDSKTGARLVPLSPPAARVPEELPRIDGNPWVILGMKPGRNLSDLNHYWDRVRKRAKLTEVRIHDLRHSFASRALALGESLSMIGKLLGHTHLAAIRSRRRRPGSPTASERTFSSASATRPPRPHDGPPAASGGWPHDVWSV